MPNVYVTYNSLVASPEILRRLAAELPSAVVSALGVPGTGGALAPNEINVKFDAYGLYDVHEKAVDILVIANEYPERMLNFKSRGQRLRDGLAWLTASNISSSVWIRFDVGVYYEI